MNLKEAFKAPRKLVETSQNTAAIAIIALVISAIALIAATRKGN